MNYFDKNVFTGEPIYPKINNQDNLTLDESIFKNILRMNKNKKVTINMTFKDSIEFKDKEFSGIIEHSGTDYIILSDPKNGKWFLLPTIYINFIIFDEQINLLKNF